MPFSPPSLRATAVVLAAAGALAAPAGAQAAEVLRDGSTLVLRGLPGEENHLSARLDEFDAGRLVLSDRTDLPITADPALGCELSRSGFAVTARCPYAGITAVRIAGGDGNDELDISPHDFPFRGDAVVLDGGPGDDDLEGPTTALPVVLAGGDGNDDLLGGQGPDRLDGGAGADVLDGNDGDDAVLGGTGDDTLRGGRTRSADLVDGGPGRDTIAGDWFDANNPEDAPLAVTFDGVANDGRPGEGDDVRSVEVIATKRVATLVAGDGADAPVQFTVTNTQAGGSRLVGTPFGDLLRTDAYDDVIEAGAGADAIDAGYGSDTITPGPGQDTVLADGGAGACDAINCPLPQGNDVIHARDGERDSIDCGPGTDTVIVDAIDVIAGCEIVDGQSAPPPGGTTTPGGGTTTTPGGTTTTPPGGGGGTSRTCRPPRIEPGTTLAVARKRLQRARCTVKVRRVASRRAKGRVVRVTRRGGTVTVHVSRGRR